MVSPKMYLKSLSHLMTNLDVQFASYFNLLWARYYFAVDNETLLQAPTVISDILLFQSYQSFKVLLHCNHISAALTASMVGNFVFQ